MTGVLAAAGGRELWYLTRATGIVTLVLLTGAVALGVAATGTWERARWPRFVTQGLHRNLSMLSICFLFLHVATTVVDGYVPIGWADAVVPFATPYHRAWVGLGTVACDLLLALTLTSMVRRRLRPGTWRGIHWLAYASWPVALLHAVGTGTDVTAGVLRAVAAACMLVVAGAAAWRLAHRFPAGPGIRVAGGVALLLVLLVGALGLDGGLRGTGAQARLVAAASPGGRGSTADGAGRPEATLPAPPPSVPPAVVLALPAPGTPSPPSGPAVPAATVSNDTSRPLDSGTGGDAGDAGQGDAPPAPTTTTTTPTTTTTSAPTTTTTTTTTTTAPTTTTTTTPKHCWRTCHP